jgi:twitching motility protein PilT
LKVDGALQRLEQFGLLSDHDLTALVNELVPAAKRKELTEQLQVDFAYAQGDARFRVNCFVQRGHPSLVLRYVRSEIRSIDELGLPELVKELVGNDNGLILMVGPTGSGKSTSLAAMVDHINANFEKHIITIEDPVEYVYGNQRSVVEQREIGVDAVSFPSALRAVLREAPDVILLGEMRDLESISAAITVAETGHLVLSTIHANSAPGTIDRIIDVFPSGQKDQVRVQLADILLGVINQRLVPKADGNGSTLIIEVMLTSSAVANAIRTGNSAQLPTIIQTSAAEGMCLLDDALLRAVRKGEISKENALAFASNRTEMRKELAG